MSNLGDQLQDEIDAILSLQTAAEKGTGEDGDPFADEIDAYIQEVKRVFDNAAPDVHDHAGDTLTANIVGTRHSVPSGESVTVPEGYSEVVVGPYDLEGELTVNGRMEIL